MIHHLKKYSNYLNNIAYLGIGTILLINHNSIAQTESENQFENQLQLNKTIGKDTALEFDISQTFRSGTVETNPFYKNSQESFGLWIHYFTGKKWKLSGMGGFVYNRSVPEINQRKLPEVRLTFQGTYYIVHSDKFVLTSRTRIEDRILGDTETNTVEIVYRFREMIKIIHPLTNVTLGKGAMYAIASEEFFLKNASAILGQEIFDRNQFLVGLGYTFTDYFQLEINYINEYVPRSEIDKTHHMISTKLIFNDIVSVLKKRLGTIPSY